LSGERRIVFWEVKKDAGKLVKKHCRTDGWGEKKVGGLNVVDGYDSYDMI